MLAKVGSPGPCHSFVSVGFLVIIHKLTIIRLNRNRLIIMILTVIIITALKSAMRLFGRRLGERGGGGGGREDITRVDGAL